MKGEVWRRFFNPVVMEVFVEYSRRGGVLFAITGDLDNLGVYVARNGRPAAENLVDLYNQVTRNLLEDLVDREGSRIRSFCFVPCGEESFALGIAIDETAAEALFGQLRVGVMELMRNQPYIPIGETSASFGCAVLGDEIGSKIEPLVRAVEAEQPDEMVFSLYLEVLTEIRRQTAIALDKEKFRDVLNGKHPVGVRKLVHTRMILYKRTTREILRLLNELPREDVESLLELLGDVYGVEPGKEDEVDNLINQIIGGANGQQ